MVKGMDQFKAHFADFADRYVLIGGAACFLAMKEAGLEFRVTKDLDIVLCLEALDPEFVGAFWDFVKKGGYKNQQKSSGPSSKLKTFWAYGNPYRPGNWHPSENLWAEQLTNRKNVKSFAARGNKNKSESIIEHRINI